MKNHCLRYFKYPVNTRLQGKGQLINKMYDHIFAFQMKLGLWEQLLKFYIKMYLSKTFYKNDKFSWHILSDSVVSKREALLVR